MSYRTQSICTYFYAGICNAIILHRSSDDHSHRPYCHLHNSPRIFAFNTKLVLNLQQITHLENKYRNVRHFLKF